MAVPLNVTSIEELPESMREFVTEADGGFHYDADSAFAALKQERVNSKTARNSLAPFKALGKTAEELQALIEAATSSDDGHQKLTAAEQQNRSLEKQLKALQQQFATLQEEAEKNKKAATDAKLRKIAGDLVDNLPDEIDKDRARAWLLGSKTSTGVEITGAYKNFALDDDGDLCDVSGISAEEWLKETAAALGFKKGSVSGGANPGNGLLTNTKAAAFDAAKSAGDLKAMLANAPAKQ